MIIVEVIFINRILNKYMVEEKCFNCRIKALRFMYGMRRKGHIINGWRCDHEEDNEYLSKRFKLKDW
ncbi:MAG: hypothetical protein J6T10_27180 [Methanobrevibacter sp.]|nr:hypothetical protein [Methanobrevibacter sp.]